MWSIDDFKIGTGPSSVQIKQEIKPVYYLCKQKIDQYIAKTRMEAFRLKRAKTDSQSNEKEDKIDLEISYTPCFILEGTHEIKHLRKNVLQIPFQDDIIAINIDETIIYKKDLKQSKDKSYEINITELVTHKNSNRLILDAQAKSIKEKDIPDYDLLDKNTVEEILDKQQIQADISEDLLIENFKTSILKPSQNNIKTLEENLNINLKIILRAKFIGKIRVNDKLKMMTIDSVTGESKIE
ncbi:MAG: hypothetical protein EAX96_12845 [Candidatus Lokiarchaeota archaeon]|nr:hypothetical protein [Candidatus Lokiarchaeota archaeon]